MKAQEFLFDDGLCIHRTDGQNRRPPLKKSKLDLLQIQLAAASAKGDWRKVEKIKARINRLRGGK